jgi:hypothetical protein
MGINEARYLTLQGIGKADQYDHINRVGAEAICSRLGMILGLPVPPGVVVQDPDGRFTWVSLQFGDLSALPAPIVPPALVQHRPADAAGVIVFDHWVGNDDRHDGNLAFSQGNLPLAVFDHDQALGGGFRSEIPLLPGKADQALLDPANHCLMPHAPPAHFFEPWLDLVRSTPASLIEAQCADLVRAGYWTDDEAAAVSAFLTLRREHLSEILRSQLPSLNWGPL